MAGRHFALRVSLLHLLSLALNVRCVSAQSSNWAALAVIFTVTAFALSKDAAWIPQVRSECSDTAPEQQIGAHHNASAEMRAADGRPRHGKHQEHFHGTCH
jgi:hypothetical protein